MTNINFRIDEKTKQQATELFNELSIDMSTALTMFLKQAIRDGGLPFMPNVENMRKAGITVIENQEQLLEAINEAEEDVKSGKVYPIDDVIRDMKKKYDLQYLYNIQGTKFHNSTLLTPIKN